MAEEDIRQDGDGVTPVPEPDAAADNPPPEADVPASDAAEAAASGEPSSKQWYILHTYSGFEQKVAESLRTRAEAFGYADKIGQVLIPTEEVIELRNGRKALVTEWRTACVPRHGVPRNSPSTASATRSHGRLNWSPA